MTSTLLETKLYVPKPRRGLITRARLSDLLSRGAESKLTADGWRHPRWTWRP